MQSSENLTPEQEIEDWTVELQTTSEMTITKLEVRDVFVALGG